MENTLDALRRAPPGDTLREAIVWTDSLRWVDFTRDSFSFGPNSKVREGLTNLALARQIPSITPKPANTQESLFKNFLSYKLLYEC